MSSIHYFPVEVLYNIVGRLPVKEIIRFRCVCKAWRDLVVDPYFISTHLNLQIHSDRCLLQYLASKGVGAKDAFLVFHARNFADHSNFEFPFSCDIEYFKIVGSVNGLLCLSPYELFGQTLYLWNPSIRKLKNIAEIYKWETCFVIGFGFHHPTNDYKIVRIMYFAEVGKIQPPTVEVFSLARNSWTKVGANFGCSARDRSSSVVVNGCVHWFAYRTKDASAKFILAFDFGSEEFGEIMLPEYHHNGDTQFEHDSHKPEVFLTVLRESLALIASCCKNRMVCYNIWVMREYGIAESWSKQYSVVPNERVYRCFGIVNNKDLMLQAGFEKGVISYDLDKQEYKPLGFTECLFELVTFRESLVLYEEGYTPQKDLLAERGICCMFREMEEPSP